MRCLSIEAARHAVRQVGAVRIAISPSSLASVYLSSRDTARGATGPRLRAPSISSVSAQTSASARSGRAARPVVVAAGHQPAQLVLECGEHPARGAPGRSRRARRPARRAPPCRGWRGPAAPAARFRRPAARFRPSRPPWLASATTRSAAHARAAWRPRAPSAPGVAFSTRAIGQHPADPVLAERGDHDPAGVALGRGRRIDADHHPPRRRAGDRPRGTARAAPRLHSAPSHLLDQLAVELLPAEQRAAELPPHRCDEAGRQVEPLSLGRAARDDRLARAPPSRCTSGTAPRRGGRHHLRAAAEPQAQQQVVPGAFARPPARSHLAISSHQAWLCCGPRRLSGSPAE